MADVPLFVMQGLPGSGKSYWARVAVQLNPDAEIVSADDYPGLYDHDTTGKVIAVRSHLLGPAHGACFRAAVRSVLTHPQRTLVVDNTNTTVAEVAPYIMLAQAYGLAPVIVRVIADPEVCAARNTHGVPREAIERMAQHLKQFTAPAHWRDIPGYAVREVP